MSAASESGKLPRWSTLRKSSSTRFATRRNSSTISPILPKQKDFYTQGDSWRIISTWFYASQLLQSKICDTATRTSSSIIVDNSLFAASQLRSSVILFLKGPLHLSIRWCTIKGELFHFFCDSNFNKFRPRMPIQQNRMPPVMRPPTSAPPVNAISSAHLAALQNQMHHQQNQNQIRQNMQHRNIPQNAHHAQNMRGPQSPLVRSPVVSPGPPRPRKNWLPFQVYNARI